MYRSRSSGADVRVLVEEEKQRCFSFLMYLFFDEFVWKSSGCLVFYC